MSRLILLPPILLVATVGIVWFVWQYRREKRSLWLGISFLAALLPVLGLCAVILLMFEHLKFAWGLLVAGGIAFLAVILLFPVALITTLLVSGIQLIRREGFSLSHML